MKSSLRLSGAVAGLLLLPAVLWADSPQPEIPFKLYRGYTIVVRGSIGSLDKLNFLIDTGAVPSVVDERVARKLKLVGKAERVTVFSQDVTVREVILPELQLGPVRAESLRVLVRALAFLEEGLGTRVDAMVGLDVLARSNFTIDFAAKKITFGTVDVSGLAIPFLAGLLICRRYA